jgi:hypothetical protein
MFEQCASTVGSCNFDRLHYRARQVSSGVDLHINSTVKKIAHFMDQDSSRKDGSVLGLLHGISCKYVTLSAGF